MTHQQLFDLVQKYLKDANSKDSTIDETAFVNSFIEIGFKHLKSIAEWEPTHQTLREEHGRQFSHTKEDTMREIIIALSENPNLPLEEVNSRLMNYGFSLGTIDKIHILMAQKDSAMINAEYQTSKKRE